MDAAEPPPEARQRWRLTLAIDADAPSLTSREGLAAWVVALEASGLSVAYAATRDRRPRIVVAAPLGRGVAAEAELVDVALSALVTIAEARTAFATSLPPGHRLEALEDVWVGAPSLPVELVAADHRVGAVTTARRGEVVAAVATVLVSSTVLVDRARGGSTVRVDIRPFIETIELVAAPDDGSGVEPDGRSGRVILRIRTRMDPSAGTGRPDDVVAAVAQRLGMPLVVERVVRERLRLRSDLD